MEDIEKGGKILRQNKLKDKNSIGDKTIFKKGNILYKRGGYRFLYSGKVVNRICY